MKKILGSLGNYLLIGALLLAPVAITALIVQKLFDILTDWVGHFSPVEFQSGWRAMLARIAALLLVLVVVFLIGAFAHNFVGRRLYTLGDWLLSRTPGIKLFYNFFRQIIEVLFANRDSSFKEVVMLEYPRAGAYTIGFVTSAVPEPYRSQVASAKPGEECVSVFIPATPNPTSGWFAIVPRSQIIPLKMTPAEGMKLIVSGGSIYPGMQNGTQQASLLDRLESWVEKPDKNKEK